MKRRFLALVLAGCLAAVLSTAAWAMSPTGFYLNVELPSGKTIALDVESGDSIDNVKEELEMKTKIAAGEQHLYYGGKLLVDGRTLANYNIQKGSTLLLTTKIKGTPTGEKLTEENMSGSTIGAPVTISEKTLNSGTYYLCNNVKLTQALVIQGDVTLDLNGFVLQHENRDANDSVIKIESGTLTLVDSNPDAIHKFVKEATGLWTLNENAGTEIVKGGVITGGTGSTYKYNNDIGQIVYNDCGGGVFVAPGASFIMEGGNIVGCSAGKSGGGVKVTNDGDFKMSGGTISGCTAGGGGGIDNRGTTTLSDNAKIKSCSATGTERDDHGGGVCSYRNLTVSGNVVITGCEAANGISGAMYVDQSASSIKGGTFDGSVLFDDEVSVSGGTFNGDVQNKNSIISGGTFLGGVRGAWTVTFDTDGGSAVAKQIRANAPATKPSEPTKDGFDFGGWYTDAAFTTEYKFTESEKVTQDMPLYAKWTKEAAKYYYYSPADGSANAPKASPKTFDAGVGVYVGMAVLSVCGSAVVLGKKRK